MGVVINAYAAYSAKIAWKRVRHGPASNVIFVLRASEVNDLLLQASSPVVFTGMIDGWSSKNWTPAYLAQVLKEKKYRCKIAPRKCEDQIWETDCAHTEASLSEFCQWTSGHIKGDNPLCHISPDDFSCYIDYKYMPQMFENCSHMLKAVDWSVFGLTDRDGQDSTIWIGSKGASTPCHYDTYGFNLVAQIHGKKRWHLFPPSCSDCLYPTRLPYEESSVFSEVNVAHPDLGKTSKFQCSKAVVVTLHPGQVLYVPQHWWHYVECLETALSINTWVELLDDDKSRLSESITRATVSCLVSSEAGENLQDWINPNEDIMSIDVNWTYLEKCLHQVGNKTNQIGANINLVKDNLHIFSHCFNGSQYITVHAPWDIPMKRHMVCGTNAQGRLMTSVLNSSEHCYTPRTAVSGKRRLSHSTVEALEDAVPETSPTKVLLLDIKNASTDGLHVHPLRKGSNCDSESDKCKIFFLQPSNFETYFKLVHGVDNWNKLSVCDRSGDTLRQYQSHVLDEQQQGFSQSVSIGVGRSELTKQKLGDGDIGADDTSAVSKHKETSNDSGITGDMGRGGLPLKDEPFCGEDVNNQTGSDAEKSSSMEGAGLPTSKGESRDSVTTDLSAVRHMFFKSLLHPRVVKVIAKELVDNFALLKK